MDEVENTDEPQHHQVHLVDRPVVLLPIADVALTLGPVQPTPLHLGGHLPAEGIAAGHARQHRSHQRPRSLLLALTPPRLLGLAGLLGPALLARLASPFDL